MQNTSLSSARESQAEQIRQAWQISGGMHRSGKKAKPRCKKDTLDGVTGRHQTKKQAPNREVRCLRCAFARCTGRESRRKRITSRLDGGRYRLTTLPHQLCRASWWHSQARLRSAVSQCRRLRPIRLVWRHISSTWNKRLGPRARGAGDNYHRIGKERRPKPTPLRNVAKTTVGLHLFG